SGFIATAERVIDLGRVVGGRPDGAKITKSPTNLVLDATGLTAYVDGDTLEIFSLGGNTWDILDGYAQMPIAAGSTTLTAFTVDLSQLTFPGLIDGGKGDKAVITHVTQAMASGIPYTTLSQVLTLPSVTMTDGQDLKT